MQPRAHPDPQKNYNSLSFASFKSNLIFHEPTLRSILPSPPSDCMHLIFSPPADHAYITNTYIVLYCPKEDTVKHYQTVFLLFP